MKLFLQYKIFIYPVAVVAAALILVVFVIVPQLQGFFSGQVILNSARIRLDNLDAKASTLQNLDQKAYQDKLSAVFYSLPVDKDLDVIIGVFRNLTNSAGMILSALQIGASSEGGNSYSVTAEVIGPANNLSSLLDVIDNSPRVMKFLSLETNLVGSDLVNATIVVNVFYAPVAKSLGSVDALLPELTEKDQAILKSLTVSGSITSQEQVVLPSGKTNPFE